MTEASVKRSKPFSRLIHFALDLVLGTLMLKSCGKFSRNGTSPREGKYLQVLLGAACLRDSWKVCLPNCQIVNTPRTQGEYTHHLLLELPPGTPILPPISKEGLRVTHEDKGAQEDQVELIDGTERKYIETLEEKPKQATQTPLSAVSSTLSLENLESIIGGAINVR
jgi:hypothetical protein